MMLSIYILSEHNEKITYLGLLLELVFTGSFVNPEKISWKIGWKFLYSTVDTANLCSKWDILSLNSVDIEAISIQFFIFLKNWIRLWEKEKTVLFDTKL